MTPKEMRDRLRLRAKEAALERDVLRALRGLQSAASVEWLAGAVRRRGSVPAESLPSRLASAAGLIRRTFADSYVAAQKGVEAWRRR